MPVTAKGRFEIALTPAAAELEGAVRRFEFTKAFHGDLTGTGKGVMLSCGDPQTGEAGYVAIETVTGRLGDLSGGFALQQSGTMHAGSQTLHYQVVPGSGHDGLEGIAGLLRLSIADDGTHLYELEYELEADGLSGSGRLSGEERTGGSQRRYSPERTPGLPGPRLRLRLRFGDAAGGAPVVCHVVPGCRRAGGCPIRRHPCTVIVQGSGNAKSLGRSLDDRVRHREKSGLAGQGVGELGGVPLMDGVGVGVTVDGVAVGVGVPVGDELVPDGDAVGVAVVAVDEGDVLGAGVLDDGDDGDDGLAGAEDGAPCAGPTRLGPRTG